MPEDTLQLLFFFFFFFFFFVFFFFLLVFFFVFFLFFFLEKIGQDIPIKTIYMNCQAIFSKKKKKNATRGTELREWWVGCGAFSFTQSKSQYEKQNGTMEPSIMHAHRPLMITPPVLWP